MLSFSELIAAYGQAAMHIRQPIHLFSSRFTIPLSSIYSAFGMHAAALHTHELELISIELVTEDGNRSCFRIAFTEMFKGARDGALATAGTFLRVKV